MRGTLGPESASEKVAKGVVFCNSKLNWALSHLTARSRPCRPLWEVTGPAAAMVKYGIQPYSAACTPELGSEQCTWVHPWRWF